MHVMEIHMSQRLTQVIGIVMFGGCAPSDAVREPHVLGGHAELVDNVGPPAVRNGAGSAQDRDPRRRGSDDLDGFKAGTSGPIVEVQTRSTTYASVSGICLEDDGRKAWGGLGYVTCPITTRGGELGQDERDYGDGHDHPEDCDEDELFVLAGYGASATWHAPTGRVALKMDSVFTGGLMQSGVVALGLSGGACLATLLEDVGSAPIEVDLPPAVCSEHTDLSIDRASNTAWFANGTLWRLAGDGTFDALSDHAGNLLVYDDATATLLTATEGTPTLSSLDLEGLERWSVELAGPLIELAALGDTGVVVALSSTTPSPTLHFIDANTGDELRSEATLPDVDDLTTSADGSVIGATAFRQVYFYDVRVR